jgi:cytochrome c peroxidase
MLVFYTENKLNWLTLALLICYLFYPVNKVMGQESIAAIEQHLLPQLSPKKIALGKKLFHETLLSSKGDFSCAQCHPLDKYTVDGLKFSLDINGKPLDYNTPSINYASLNQYLGWTGGHADLKAHLDNIILNPRIMNTNWPSIIERLKKSARYEQQFILAGYEGINADSISELIVTFEESLVKQSRFDLYLLGKVEQLNDKEIEGYQLFKEYGCIACHQGINIGGNMRQTFGVIGNYYGNPKVIKRRDYGYFNMTKNDEDQFLFRVPSLRNVAQTAPYFHDGSAPTLTKAIKVMFKYQVGLSPTKAEIQAIEAFLNTLDGIQ